jgi:hypothetical protein
MLSGTYVINSVMVAAMTRASTAMTATMLAMTRVPMVPWEADLPLSGSDNAVPGAGNGLDRPWFAEFLAQR